MAYDIYQVYIYIIYTYLILDRVNNKININNYSSIIVFCGRIFTLQWTIHQHGSTSTRHIMIITDYIS